MPVQEPPARQPSSTASVPRPEADRGLPTFDSRELVGIGREAVILHEGQAYRLRITSNRKLILTK